jgi:hypothetical protein
MVLVKVADQSAQRPIPFVFADPVPQIRIPVDEKSRDLLKEFVY